MTEKEYIERDALYKTVAKNVEVFDDAGANIKEQCLEHIVIAEPAADVVEVVRCKDCKFAFPYNDYYYCENENSPFTNSDWAVCPNGDDFCSYGERRCEE